MTPIKRRKVFLGGPGRLGGEDWETKALEPAPSARVNFQTGQHNARPIAKISIPSTYTMWLPGSPCSSDFLMKETNLLYREVAGGVYSTRTFYKS
jgi:hypothetical protein